jgi:hypothetical protein
MKTKKRITDAGERIEERTDCSGIRSEGREEREGK